jgi:hypothetical protein
MAIGIGQKVETLDYSAIKAKVDSVFGQGANTLGYGQIVTSPSVATNDIITAAHWLSLRNDMVKSRQHQTGVSVGQSSTNDGSNLVIIESGSVITNTIREQYATFADTLVTNKFNTVPSQLSSGTLVDAQRTDPWNNIINHTITITGSSSGNGSAENLRYFFNAGGKINIQASRTGTSSSKNNSWSTLLQQLGTITLNHSTTTSTGTVGIGVSQGFHNLTTSYITLFNANSTGIYAANYYKVQGKVSADKSQLILNIQFADETAESPVDQNISGTLSSIISQEYPTGSNVSLLPLSATHQGFDANTAISSYIITPNTSSVNEGSSVTFNIVSNDIPGTVLYWTLTGSASSNDFTDNAMSGSVTLGSNGTANFTKQLSADLTTEGSESFSAQLRTSSISGPIVATSTAVTINDTSTTVIITSYSITPSITSVNEGSSVTFNISANNSTETSLYWTISGGVSSNDFTDNTMSGSVTLSSGTASFTKQIAADLTTEGVETFVVQLRTGSISGPIVATSSTVTINDTSTSPLLPSYLINNITNVDQTKEDVISRTVVFTITAQNHNGSPLYYSITGTVDSSDFETGSQLSGPVSLVNNTATVTVVVAKGVSTEPNDTFTLKLFSGTPSGTLLQTSSIVTITSTAPAITYNLTADKTLVKQGETVNFTLTTTGVPSGTILYYSLDGTGLNATSFNNYDIIGSLSSQFTHNGGTLNIPIKIAVNINDRIEGQESFIFNLRTTSITGQIVTSSPVVTIAAHGSSTWNVPGSTNEWIVPAGVTSINISALGAGGGSSAKINGQPGALVETTIPVTPGQVLKIYPGGAGENGVYGDKVSDRYTTGGVSGLKYNGVKASGGRGGAAGWYSQSWNGGGGGAGSFVTLDGIMAVAAGGGGGSGNKNAVANSIGSYTFNNGENPPVTQPARPIAGWRPVPQGVVTNSTIAGNDGAFHPGDDNDHDGGGGGGSGYPYGGLGAGGDWDTSTNYSYAGVPGQSYSTAAKTVKQGSNPGGTGSVTISYG